MARPISGINLARVYLSGGMFVMVAAIETAAPAQKVVYDGRLGELYGIFFKNLLLTIVTLGIYRFWGKTNMRRYIWSHVSFQGDRFEYTGTGGELFKGFLVALAFFALLAFVQFGAQLVFGIDSVIVAVFNLVAAFSFLYFVYVAVYAAQRYRLTRTLWRGVRGGMTGSAWRFGFKGLGAGLLQAVTLMLMVPYTQFRLLEDRFNNSYFGDAKARIKLSAGNVFGLYLLGFAIIVAATLLAIWLGRAMLGGGSIIDALIEVQQSGDEQQAAELVLVLIVIFYGWVLIVGLASLFAFAPYYAAVTREIANNLEFAELRFRSQVTTGKVVRLWLVNALIYLLTAGLGLPIVIHRILNFGADNYEVLGQVDGARLMQTTLERPRTGEGLLEAFDPGLF